MTSLGLGANIDDEVLGTDLETGNSLDELLGDVNDESFYNEDGEIKA